MGESREGAEGSTEAWRLIGVSAHPQAPAALAMLGALRRGEMERFAELAARAGSLNPRADWGAWLADLSARGEVESESVWPDEQEPLGTVFETALAHHDDPLIIDRIVGLGVSPNAKIGGVSLMGAALAGRGRHGGGFECVIRLAQAGADPAGVDPGLEPAAWAACWEGEPRALRALLEAGLDPNWRDPSRPGEAGSLLRLCLEKERCVSQEGRAACARALLAAGADPALARSAASQSLLEEIFLGQAGGWRASLPYLSETGLGPRELLPSSRSGFEALDRAWRAALGVLEYPEGLYEAERRESHMAWLPACFEAMRLELSTPEGPRGARPGL